MATAAALSSNVLALEKIRFETFFIDDTISLCTYQCNAPLPQVRAEVGEGGDL